MQGYIAGLVGGNYCPAKSFTCTVCDWFLKADKRSVVDQVDSLGFQCIHCTWL